MTWLGCVKDWWWFRRAKASRRAKSQEWASRQMASAFEKNGQAASHLVSASAHRKSEAETLQETANEALRRFNDKS